MIFYEITLTSVPKIIFACDVDNQNYKNSFSGIKGFLEIAVHRQGHILYEFADGTNEIVGEREISLIIKDLRCKTSAVNGERQKHITVGVTMDYDCIKRDTEDHIDINDLKRRVKDNNIILLPYHWDLEDKYNSIVELLQKIIYYYSSLKTCDSINALGAWFYMVGILTKTVLKKLDDCDIDNSPSTANYLNKAKLYIIQNCKNKITVGKIAEALGISEGYLHHIFKKANNTGITEYINTVRVELAKEYIRSNNISLKEASYLVGINDPAYMSRLFKKVSGMTYREYCSICFTEKKI